MSAPAARAPDPLPPVRLLGDIACPWTYLALASLQRAFGERLRLEWHPFLLNTRDLARQRDRLAGPVAHYAGVVDAPFDAAGLAQPLDAHVAHGVVLAAGREGRAAEAARALFDARFAAARPLDERRAITAALVARVDETDARAWLEASTANAAVVDRATRAARLAGVSEIPLAVVDNAHVIGGLQPPEAYRALVELAVIQKEIRA
jgi:predicted DsbA family dithiol-disulfide isomerase